MNVKTFLLNGKENLCNSVIKMQAAINFPTICYDSYSNKAPFTLAGEIWKRRFHSESASNVFRWHYAREIWKANIIGYFRFVFQENSGREMTGLSLYLAAFSKRSVFKIFSVQTKAQWRRSQIFPVWRAFWKSCSVFVTD